MLAIRSVGTTYVLVVFCNLLNVLLVLVDCLDVVVRPQLRPDNSIAQVTDSLIKLSAL